MICKLTWRSFRVGTAACCGSLPTWRTACRKMSTCTRKWRRKPASCSCSFRSLLLLRYFTAAEAPPSPAADTDAG